MELSCSMEGAHWAPESIDCPSPFYGKYYHTIGRDNMLLCKWDGETTVVVVRRIFVNVN